MTGIECSHNQLFVRKPIDKLAVALVLLLCPIWGFQQVAIKAVAADVPPALQVTLRSLVAALLVFILSRVAMREQWLRNIGWREGLGIGVLFAAEFLFVAEGLRWTSAAHMAMFLYTAPVFAAIGLHLAALPEERLNRIQWGGVLLSFAGVATTFLQPSGQGDNQPLWLLGDLMGLCAGAAWGLRTTIVRASKLSEAPPTQTLFYQLAVASVIMLVYTVCSGQMHFKGTPLAWASLGFQIFAVSFAAYLAWFWLLRRYLATRLSVLTFMTPLFGVLMGVALLDEKISLSFIVGGAMVFIGVLIVNGQKTPLPVPYTSGKPTVCVTRSPLLLSFTTRERSQR